MAGDDKSDGSGLKIVGLLIDIVSKVLLGIASIYFTYATYQNSVAARMDTFETECTKHVSHLVDFVIAKQISSDSILDLVSIIVKPRCQDYSDDASRSRLVQSLSNLTSSGTSKASSPAIALPSALPGSTDGKWVAVGFVGTPDYNFTKPNGDSLGAETTGLGTIKSKWQVNVRRRAADWQNPLSVLEAGDCFVVKDTRVLDAGGRKQLWANGDAKKCS